MGGLCNRSSKPWPDSNAEARPVPQDMHFAEALKPQDVEAGVGACSGKGIPAP